MIKKNIVKVALIAHDNCKDKLISWVNLNKKLFNREKIELCATKSTGLLIKNILPNKDITLYESGPLGGDLQIGAKIIDGQIDILIFIFDPLSSHPHEPDIKALLRVAALKDIVVATTISTAQCVIENIEI